MQHFVQIALPLPIHKQFTYSIAPDMWQDNLVGRRALVPFGKRTLTGIITHITQEPVPGAKYVHEILDDAPIYSPQLMNFTKWVADYYFGSWGETLKAALPQGMSPQSIITVKLRYPITDEYLLNVAKRAPKRAALLELLMNHKGSVSVGHLQKQLNSDSIAEQLDSLEHAGVISCFVGIEADIQPKTQKAIAILPEIPANQDVFKTILDELDKKAPKQALLLSHLYIYSLHHRSPMLLADALRETHSTSAAVQGLLKKGLIYETEIEVSRVEKPIDASESLVQREEAHLSLTIEQNHALMRINEQLTAQKYKTFLLHGVTGSGKTLVYIHAIRQALSLNKTSLLLVPEISLTPQLIDRFHAVFGEEIAVLHSRMSAGERFDNWRKIQRNEAKIVIGARSAIFAPLQNLGLIIVDEEHEPSYKQESPSPRYNARDCAIMRGGLEHAVVVLGSATPSMESMFNAGMGKYHLLEISSRADGATLPSIRVVNTKEERKLKLMNGAFSRDMMSAIEERITRKEGVILFHNRRGFASYLECTDCGDIPHCKNCSVTLTYHKGTNLLRCHYCSYNTVAVQCCEVCGSVDIREVGTGTQRIEEELEHAFNIRGMSPKIQRMDLDTTSQKGSHRKMLQQFSNGEIDILIGTQMVAKGLDFRRVTLVGVLNADLQLFMPDFRAAERTFQLLTQVSGRAGRSSEYSGEVIIQTAHPDHQAIIAAVAGKYELFYSDELQLRKEANYPPFTRFVLIELSSPSEQKVHEHAHYLAGLLPKANPDVWRVGPSIPTISRLRSQYRRIVVLKSMKHLDPTGEKLRAALTSAYTTYQQKHATSSVKVTIDIDSFASI
ncbi:MAG: primosomal protein N' [Ignavibacteria bacterium]|nr:primosomal protein N' [Ignavibacteria bacterium]